jgi:hypothetical protein
MMNVNTQPQGKITVTVNKAILSYDACTFQTMDPYFIATLTSLKAYRSKVRENEGKYPIWRETFEMEYSGEEKLSLDVYHEKEFIGGVDISTRDIINAGTIEKDFPLTRQLKSRGQIYVRIVYQGFNSNVIKNQNVSNNFSNVNTQLNTNTSSNIIGMDIGHQSIPINLQPGKSIYGNIVRPQQTNTSNQQTYPNFDQINMNQNNSNNYNQNQNYNHNQIYNQNQNFNQNQNYNQNQSYNLNQNYNKIQNIEENQNNNSFNPTSNLSQNQNYNQNQNQNYNNNQTLSNLNTSPQKLSHPFDNINQVETNYSNQPTTTNTNSLTSNYSQNQNTQNTNISLLSNQSSQQNSNQLTQQKPDWEKKLTYHKNALFFQQTTSDVYSYDFANESWNKLTTNNKYISNKYSRATELPDGSFFITGGENQNGTSTKSAAHFLNLTFAYKADMINARKAHTAIYLKGFLYVLGGFDSSGKITNSSERFDLNSNNGWKQLANMTYNKAYATPLAYQDNYIFIIGGFCDQKVDNMIELNRIERFDIQNNKFDEFTIKMPVSVYGCFATLISDTKMLIGGGWSEEKQNSATVFTIDLSTGKIDLMNNLSTAMWTVMPVYYKFGALHMFNIGEEIDCRPDHYYYPIQVNI